MKKILLIMLILCAFSPMILYGQTISPTAIPTGFSLPAAGQDSDGGSFLSSLPLLKGLKTGKIVLNPSVQIGYQHLGSNISLPASAIPRGPNDLFIGTLDVTLQDFNFWTGTVGLNVVVSPFTLFGSVGGYAPRLFAMKGNVPVTNSVGSVAPDLTFTGTNFEYWTAQCGAAYTICGGYSILAGYAWSHTAAEFSDPRVGSVPLSNQSFRGDVSMNVGVPFIGVQMLQQGYYRAALMYSPLARSSGALSLQTSSPSVADLRYSLNQPGTFFAVNAEYYFVFKPPVILSCWFLGTLVNIRGTSDLEFTAPVLNVTRDVTISNTQYGLAGGVTFGAAF